MKYCRKCGTQVQEGIRYCPNCGTEFTKTSQEAPPQTQVKFCRACAKEVPADAKYCRFCGYRFDAALSDGASTPIRGTAAGPAAKNTGARRPAAQVQKDSSYEKIKTEKGDKNQ